MMSVSVQDWSGQSVREDYQIRFPVREHGLDQDEEWFEFNLNGQPQRLRIHDYADLYRVPGLYEALVYDKLLCQSPQCLANLLSAVLKDRHVNVGELRALDLGAGNGIVAEELYKLGARHLVGLDLLPEARLAALRDRPALYADYLVTDLTAPNKTDLHRLEDHRLNCLLTVAALGFGDIPPQAFGTAFNSIVPSGWLGITIKEDFLQPEDHSGFASFVKAMIEQQVIEIQAHQRYCHRLSISGEKLFYLAVVARKVRNVPATLFDEVGHETASEFNGTNAGHTTMLLGG